MTETTGSTEPTAAAPAPSEPTAPPYRAPGVIFSESDALRIAGTVVEYGWYSSAARLTVPITPVMWDDPEYEPVVTDALQAWEPLDAILTAHGVAPGTAPIDVAIDYAHSWLDLTAEAAYPSLGIAGRRAIRIAYLAAVTEDDRVREAARHHFELLAATDPTDGSERVAEALVGALMLCGTLGDAERTNRTVDVETRLAAHLHTVVTDDGIHRSQSPGRQKHLIDLLVVATGSGLLFGEDVGTVRSNLEHGLAWLVDPDGRPANFGTTTEAPVSPAYDTVPTGIRFLSDRIVDPALLHVATRGRRGSTPEVNRKIFHDGGFAVIKEPWPRRSDDELPPTSHLVLRTGPPTTGAGVDAGLAFTWHESGYRLIVEPGPSPIDSDHPAASHPAGPEAHNRVVVGEADAGDDTAGSPPAARTAPIGGGLQRWGVMEGRYFFDAYESTADLLHRRSIMYEPGSWLVIADVVDVVDGRPVGPRFHLAEDLDLLATQNRFTVLRDTRPIAWAASLANHPSIAAARGRIEPSILGWYSPDGIWMVPNWTFGWETEGRGTFVTLLCVDERPAVDERRGAWYGWHTSRYQARVAVTEWGIVDIDIRPKVEEEG